jgi:hypothetical protein
MYNRSGHHVKCECSILLWYCPIFSRNDAIQGGSHCMLTSRYMLTILMTEIRQIVQVLVTYQLDIDEIPERGVIGLI